MTDHVDLEPAVRAFLREREARRPDPTHVLRHVVGETRKVPQRRHWWQGHAGSGVPSPSGDRRGRVVQPRLLFASLAVMSLLVVTVALALVLSGSDDSPSVGAPASPSPAAADGPTIIVAQDGSGDVTSLSEAIDRRYQRLPRASCGPAGTSRLSP